MKIQFGNRRIGHTEPVFIIAEAADAHYGNMDVAFAMVRGAKESGADCIKFQHHLPDEEMLPEIPMSDNFAEPLYQFLKRCALSIDQHRQLKNYCDQIGILYLCTPFSYAAAKELKSIGLEVFKIGSGEFTDLTSLKAIIGLGNPLILSTGMCTFEEIHRSVRSLKSWGAQFCLTNCVSEYPPLYEDINLGVIPQLKTQFPDIVIGHSDHTPDVYTSFAAVALGAKIIEKHIALDRSHPGPDQSVSITIPELATLVGGIRKIEKALGTTKKVHPREEQIRSWAFRSVVSTKNIPQGSILTEEMLWTKRPGTGIASHELPHLIGKRTKRPIEANTLLHYDDIE